MAAITLNNGSKVVNLIPNSVIRLFTTGVVDPFAVLEGGGILVLHAQHTLHSITIADANENSLNRAWDVPGTITVPADGELSIGKAVVNVATVVDWDINLPA